MDIRRDAPFHTNGTVGYFFSQVEVEVFEVRELSGSVELEHDIAGSVEVSPQIGGNVEVTYGP